MKKQYILLAIIFLLTLSFRLYFAFQTPFFSYDAYFDLRQINQIATQSHPVFNDSLSYGGRTTIFIPTFHYILAFFSLFMPVAFVAKLLPNIFASSAIIIVYLISKKLTNSINLSLLASFLSGFIPAFIAKTTNSVSAYTLTIPLIFLAIYFLMSIKSKTSIYSFVGLIFIISFLHPSVLLLIAALLAYLFLVRLEKIEHTREEIELILFATFLAIWLQFLIFKGALLAHGHSVIWQNLPLELKDFYFTPVDILQSVFKIGLVPLLCGIYVIYLSLLKEKSKELYIIIGFIISTSILLWAKLIPSDIGMSFLGILLAILFAKFCIISLEYLQKTNFSHFKLYISLALIAVFLISSLIPSIYFTNTELANVPEPETISLLAWLNANSAPDATILATADEGYLINAVAGRKTAIDTNFLLISNPSQRLNDTKTIYTTQYKTEAVRLLNKYHIDYILFSTKAKSKFGIEQIPYIKDTDCFKPLFTNNVSLYKSVCRIEEV